MERVTGYCISRQRNNEKLARGFRGALNETGGGGVYRCRNKACLSHV